mgnify:CR=1 FL=1
MIVLKRLTVHNFKLLRRVELAFPGQGSILIEGLNESGKSTLFESVFYALYGVPLALEGRGKGNLESVIRYGEESASVELVLQVDDTELEIRRSVRRGRPSQASLAVRRAGAPEERVAGVLAVNARVVDEMGGLDADALLNSCFVEQKKLSKLEDLAPGQRKESVRRLLNLERLTDLADEFRVSQQEERALAEARQRLELALVTGRLPALAEERAQLEARLGDGEGMLGPGSAASEVACEGRGRVGWDWSPAADRLAAVRRSMAAARGRGAGLALAAGMGLVGSAIMGVSGIDVGVWLLPIVAVLALLAAGALRSAGRLSREAARLESVLASARDAVVAKTGELEGLRRRAEESLGVDGVDLDPEECRRRVEALARQMEVKRRAAAIVEGAMERIVRLVLPNTERNLGQILPLLTAGRYHEARIGEDYQIQVWDDTAGRYVSKSVFSGGARDQFSLALRLAFALPTLPQELGTTPGFIFLDEPLSSFDGPRTEALVRLLTTGQIAGSFSQIFVISHNRSFDAGAFQYRLVMRDGRVVDSNLPPPERFDTAGS